MKPMWLVTHKETKKRFFVLSNKWFDVRALGHSLLTSENHLLDVEALPDDFDYMKAAETEEVYEISYHGTAYNNPSTLRRTITRIEPRHLEQSHQRR